MPVTFLFRGLHPSVDSALSLFAVKVHCISTEFTMRKHGGEKGVPFRIQIDTFKENESEEYTEHLHSASCQVKVFKVRDQTLMLCAANLYHHQVMTCSRSPPSA